MKLKTGLLGLLCFFYCSELYPRSPERLKVGDRVPQLLIKDIIGITGDDKDTSLKLNSFNNKLLILDFWATYCTPCLHLLPKYDSLQTEFGNQVQFLLVTRESSQKARSFFQRFPYHLPSVTSDTLLAALFPHTSIPHEVWIKNGKVAAVTFGEDVNKAAIDAMLAGKNSGMDQKQDDLGFDSFEPLLINGNGGTGKVAAQSLITPYIPGLRTVTGFQQTQEKIISIALNTTVLSLYEQACSHTDPLMELDNRFIINLPDSLKDKIEHRTASLHEFLKNYGFCYNLILPPEYSGDITATMLYDLNRFFATRYHISASIKAQQMNCLVLSRIKGERSLNSNGGEAMIKMDDHIISLKNTSIAALDMELAQRYRKLPQPFVDETGYRTPVDLVISGNLSDLKDLNKALAANGLELNFTKRKIAMVIITQVGIASPKQFNP